MISGNTDEEEAVVSPNETNNLMGIIEEEDSSIDFNSSLRSKPLSDGGDNLHQNMEANTGHHNMASEPVNIIQTMQIPNEKVFESNRAEEQMNVEISDIQQINEEMTPIQENRNQNTL